MCDTYEAVLSKPWKLADRILQSLRNDSLGGGKKRRKKAQPRERRVEKVSQLEQSRGVQGAEAKMTPTNSFENEHAVQGNGNRESPSAEPSQDASNITMAHECGNYTNVTRESNLNRYTVSSTLSTDNEDAPRGKMLDDAQYSIILKGDSALRGADLHIEFGSSNAPPPGNQQAILNTDQLSSEVKRTSQDSDQLQHNAAGKHITNKGSPSEWDTLDIGASVPERDGSKTLYDNEWLRRRDNMASLEFESSHKTPLIPLDTTRIVDKGLPSEWDALDIEASMTEHRTSKCLYDADWLEVRNGNSNMNRDYVRISPSRSYRKDTGSDTGKVQISAPY